MKKNIQLAVLGVLLSASAASFAAEGDKSTVTRVKEYIQNSVSNCTSTGRAVLSNRYVRWGALAGVTVVAATGLYYIYSKVKASKAEPKDLV